MSARTRIASVLTVTAIAAFSGDAVLRADSAAPPPGLDAFSEIVLPGTRLAVSAHAAATASDGTVHVVYGDTLLRHAWNSGSGWTSETLDATHGRGAAAALALDASGHLYVAYADPRRGELWCGTNASGTFTTRLVTNALRAIDPKTAIARTSGGTIDIAWIDDFDKTVRFATDATGNFVTTTIATDAGSGTGCDLAIAANGQPHVAFMSAAPPVPSVPGNGPRAFVHATFAAGAWTREDVESANDSGPPGVGAAGSLAFTSDGTLHAVYLGAVVQPSNLRTMRHARLAPGGWETESIGSLSATRTRLVAESGGTLHVGVQSWKDVAHLHGTWGSWTTDTLTGAAGKSGGSIALFGTSVLLPYSYATGVYSAAFASDGTSVTTTLDRTSEPLLRPSVAVDSQGSARFAVVRDDALGVHLDVIRRESGVWRTDVVATDVSKTARPSLRIDGAGASHVAFAAASGTVRVATDAGGTWTAQDFVVTTAWTQFALALASDGTRYLVFHRLGTGSLELAIGAPGSGPTTVSVATTTTGNVECDVEVGDGGIVHVAWIEMWSWLRHASGPPEAIVADADFDVESGWDETDGLELALDSTGHPWMSFTIRGQFDHYGDIATNADGEWKIRSVGRGDYLSLGFAADGSVRGTGFGSGGVQRYRPGASGGYQEVIDAGPGALRAFAAQTFAVTEDGPPLAVGIVAAASQQSLGSRVTLTGGAVDSAGGVHGAYVDRLTGDLRYVTDRDPGRAATDGLDVVRSGGDASDDDVVFAASRISFSADDSGTKFVTLTAPKDGLDEADETFVLGLGAQFATPAYGTTTTSVVIHDADPTPPPPPPPPPPVYHGSYLLPTTARMPAVKGFEAKGILHVGDAAFDPTAAGTLRLGAHTVNVPGLRAKHGSHGTWSWSAGASRFTLQRVRGSASRYRFTLRLPRSADDPDVSAPFDLSYTTDTLTAASRVSFVKGLLDVSRGTGWFEKPALHVDSFSAASGYAGRVSLAAFVADLRLRPATAPTVTLTIGSAFTATFQPSDFHADDESWIAGDAAHRLVLDYETGFVRATFQHVAVASPPDGVSALDVTIDAGAGPRTLRTQVTTHGGRFGD